MTDKSKQDSKTEREELRPDRELLISLSRGDFARLGLDDLAYVRLVTVDGRDRYAVHAADGTQLMLAGHEYEAIWAVEDHDLLPVSVH